ncbi:hypothetical protein BGZ95_002284 [Linnemannia exigua]|uniref:Uncharacterized protein n=1 Tax=Linnemannia exigua TaxID=604196 RepID=A0AAD4D5R1_9FUNG|nr:hypothetical protein BGZ95_002284 [Linnemannia exigua]
MKLDLIFLGVLTVIASAASAAPAPTANVNFPTKANATTTSDVTPRDLTKRCNSTTLTYRFFKSDDNAALTEFEFEVSGTRPYNGKTGLSMHLKGDTKRYTTTSFDGKFSVLHGNAMNSDDVILIYGNRNYSYKNKSWEGMRGSNWVSEYWDCI